MKLGRFIKTYTVTLLGAGNIALPAAIGVVMAAAGTGWPVVVGTVVGCAVLYFSIALGSGKASFAAETEKERRIISSYMEELDAMESDAEAIVNMRIPDPDVDKLKDYAALLARRLIEQHRRLKTWDPAAGAGIEEIRELLDLYKAGRDRIADSARYGMEADMTDKELKKRITGNITERINDVLKPSLDAAGLPEDRLDILEDLR